MKILKNFDSGILPPYEIIKDGIEFDMRHPPILLNAVIQEGLEKIIVDFIVEVGGKEETFLFGQGLIVKTLGNEFKAVPLKKVEEGRLRAIVITVNGEVRIASRYPYGRDSLDKLICDTSSDDNLVWRFLQGVYRGTSMAEFGDDDGKCPIHYFFAGEDSWETAGTWVADEMVRELCRNKKMAEELAEKCIIRIIPLVSPYSSAQDKGSYCTLEGDGVYGAATWGDSVPPEEYSMLRSLIEGSIKDSRLGFVMSIHSWQAMLDYSGLETIKSAGDNTLSESRQKWALNVMEQMTENVPKAKTHLADKIWHKGLARDYLLDKYAAITFRIEITTDGQGLDEFRKTGRRFLENLNNIDDWDNILGDT
jgi:hypothetical protein